MKCRLGLARSSGTESSRRPPRVVDVLGSLRLPLALAVPPLNASQRVRLFRERLVSHFDWFEPSHGNFLLIHREDHPIEAAINLLAALSLSLFHTRGSHHRSRLFAEPNG